MKRIKTGILVAATILLGVFCISTGHAEVNKPNIIFILADDLGWGDLGVFYQNSRDQNRKHATPMLDKFAAEGMQLRQHYCPAPVCAPSRASLLSGRHQGHEPIRDNQFDKALADSHTIGTVLQTAGYRTAMVGKYGLPGGDREKYDFDEWVAYPTERGFDEFFGYVKHRDGHTQYPAHAYQRGNSELHRAPKPVFHNNQKLLDELEGCYTTDLFTAFAKNWIVEHRKTKSDQPFFLYFPLSAPHTPWLPTADFTGKARAGYYGDFVNQCDHVIGQVVAALKEGGHLDNTLLVVTSDNGSHWVPGDIPKYDHRANLNYRGQKADIWEGGHRIPFLVRWPGHVKPGTSSNQTICLTDLMATAMEITGHQVPSGAGEDSYSFLSALAGDDSKSERDTIVHHSVNGTFAVRVGDWKLIVNNLGSGGFSAPRVVKPKEDGPGGQLYNLKDDPGETKNVWLEQETVVERLQEELKRIQTTGQSRRVE